MRPNKLRQLLDQKAPSLGTRIHSAWPSVIETAAHAGVFDYVEFVAEYAPFTLHDLDHMARAGEVHGLSLMIKVDEENHAYVAQRAIGSGFHSVLFTDCRGVEDARRYVRAVRPDTPQDQGRYGVAARRFAYWGYGGTPDYVQALRDVVVALMIEKQSAVACLEDILSVPGLDMVQWGPSDYSMSIGRPGERRHPEVVEAERRVFEAALRRGIPPRAEIGTADDAKRFLDMGVRHFNISYDLAILHSFWRTQGEQVRKALEG
ncbi:MAG: aldolase/citrate lyase family protein [Candidatus Latescibacterota bacterium]